MSEDDDFEEEFDEDDDDEFEDDDEGVQKLLSAVLNIQAERAHIAPGIIATSQDLRDLAYGFKQGDLEGHRLMSGWRREIAGETLLAVMEGRMALRLCPRDGGLIFETVDV